MNDVIGLVQRFSIQIIVYGIPSECTFTVGISGQSQYTVPLFFQNCGQMPSNKPTRSSYQYGFNHFIPFGFLVDGACLNQLNIPIFFQ
jgi:hypothetical protein